MASPEEKKRFHQVATVRRREGVSKGGAARKMGVPVRKLDDLENEFVNLPINVLYRWAEALNVPVTELLLPFDGGTPEPVRQRRQLVQIMKTVELIREQSDDSSVERLAKNVRRMLLKLMPELAEVRPWPKFGGSRHKDGPSQVELRMISEPMLEDLA